MSGIARNSRKDECGVREERIYLRCSPSDKAEWAALAEAQGVTLSKFITELLRAQCNKEKV